MEIGRCPELPQLGAALNWLQYPVLLIIWC